MLFCAGADDLSLAGFGKQRRASQAVLMEKNRSEELASGVPERSVDPTGSNGPPPARADQSNEQHAQPQNRSHPSGSPPAASNRSQETPATAPALSEPQGNDSSDARPEDGADPGGTQDLPNGFGTTAHQSSERCYDHNPMSQAGRIGTPGPGGMDHETQSQTAHQNQESARENLSLAGKMTDGEPDAGPSNRRDEAQPMDWAQQQVDGGLAAER